MPDTLWTERLCLEPWGSYHAKILVALAATPSVIRHVGDGRPWSEDRAREVAAATVEHWRRHGFGWRAVYLRYRTPAKDRADVCGGEPPDGPTGPVGLIALSFAGEGAGIDAGEYEIGWWMDPAVWGRGLAREGAAAVRDDAFARLNAPSLVARIAPANLASLAVAEAIGLEFESGSRGRGGEPISVLRLTADAEVSRAAPAAAPKPPNR